MKCPGLHCPGCKSGKFPLMFILAIIAIAAIVGNGKAVSNALITLIYWVAGIVTFMVITAITALAIRFHRRRISGYRVYTASVVNSEKTTEIPAQDAKILAYRINPAKPEITKARPVSTFSVNDVIAEMAEMPPKRRSRRVRSSSAK